MTNNSARNRFLILLGLRVGGPIMLLFGILVSNGRIFALAQTPARVIGGSIIAIGLIMLFVAAPRLARRWRTPGDDAP
jgi:hypothetical protein